MLRFFVFLNWNLNMNPWTYSNVSYIFGICASRRWIWVLLGVCTTPRFKARLTLKNCYFSQFSSFLNWNLNMNPLTYSNVSYIFGICASRRWIWVLLGVCTTPRLKARMTLKICYFPQFFTIFKVRRAFEPEVIQTFKSTHFLCLEVLNPNM